jgi:hypothetical protein
MAEEVDVGSDRVCQLAIQSQVRFLEFSDQSLALDFQQSYLISSHDETNYNESTT